jgi:renalase
VDVQRWLYANAEKRVDADPCLLDRDQQVIACGDWCIHGRIEAAFLSGQAAAAAIRQ